MNREPGLQPERTSMSWLRTQLLLFIIGVLIVKTSTHMNYQGLAIFGGGAILISLSVFLYVRMRFVKNIVNYKSVGVIDCLVKFFLSIFISFLSTLYLIQLWINQVL